MVDRSTVQGFIVLFIMGTSIVAAQGAIDYYSGYMSEDYVPTNATITNMTIQHIENGDDPDKYRPLIFYQYTVDGINYTNNDYTVTGDRYSSRSDAQRVIDQYFIGQDITIYYDPSNPQQSLIKKGIQQQSIRMMTIGLQISVVISLILGIVTIPDVINLYQKYKILEISKQGKILKFSAKDLSIANQIDKDKLKYYRNSLELTTPREERINQIFDDTRSLVSGFLALFLFTIHEIALILTFSGEFPEGIIILVIGAVVLLAFLLREAETVSGKVGIIIGYPFAYLFIFGMGLIVLLVIPLFLLILLFAGGIVFIIPYFLLTFVLGFSLSTTQLLGLFGVSTIVGIIILTILDYRRMMINIQYDNLAKGYTNYKHAFSNGRIELYAIDGDEQFYIGTKTGEILVLDEKIGHTPQKYQLHEGAIIDLKYFSDILFTVSNDLTLKISKVMDKNIDVIDSYPLPVISRTIHVDKNFLYLGLDNGYLQRFSYHGGKLDRTDNIQVFNDGITAIDGNDRIICIGSRDKYSKIFDKTSLEEVNDIKVHTDIISKVFVDQKEIITASVDGGLSITNLDNIKEHKVVKLPTEDEGISSVIAHDGVYLIGTTEGTLYRIDPTIYNPEFQEDMPSVANIDGIDGYYIHNLWIEDMMVKGSLLYSVSEDATIKTLHLRSDLSLNDNVSEEVRIDPISPLDVDTTISLSSSSNDVPEFCRMCGESSKPLISCSSCKSRFHLHHFQEGISQKCPNCFQELGIDK